MGKINQINKIAMAAALVISGSAQAAGFALSEQNASGMGNAYAGAAAVAEDASTIFFNPAGMTYIDGTQAVGALHVIRTSGKFNDKGSVAGAFQPLGSEGPNLGDMAYVPNFYLKTNLSPTVSVGVGVSVPFGLKTEYDGEWMGRFQGDRSVVETININPSIAFKVNDQLSLGFGVSAMRAEATLTRSVNFGPFAGEGATRVNGDDWGFGFNLGAIYQATNDTRFGVAYRSKVKQRLEGDVKFFRPTLVPAAAAPDGDVKAGVDLPESFSASVFSHVSDKWDLMADVTWTRWSRFKELRIVRDNGDLLALTPQNWENTMRYSVGASYQYNSKVKLRAGLAYDEEAIKDEFRTARIPGNDRTWLSIGASYIASPTSKFDIGYSHLFIKDAKVDDDRTGDAPLGNGRLVGDFEGSADILSLQYTHNF